MSNGQLFDPPPKPKPRLSDEKIAVAVGKWLQAWGNENAGYEDDEIGQKECDELAEALMATDSDSPAKAREWLRNHRPKSQWMAGDNSLLITWKLKDACEAVLPAERR